VAAERPVLRVLLEWSEVMSFFDAREREGALFWGEQPEFIFGMRFCWSRPWREFHIREDFHNTVTHSRFRDAWFVVRLSFSLLVCGLFRFR
jgi:hypothetical protein